jgi:hypothetical protein
LLAALLYAGAAAVGLLSRRHIEREARLQRGDLPRLLAMAGFGAVIGPVALAWGLQNTSATSASLMLAGVVLHLAESHAHAHEHEALEHAHAHRHDDGHHDHLHDPLPAGAHSHRHRHAPTRH